MIKKITALFSALILTLTGAQFCAFAARVSSFNNTVIVKGRLDGADKTNVSLLLLKSDSDIKNVSSQDIGYIAQTKTDNIGNFSFSFKFDGFEFDKNGNVNNYKLMLNQGGKNVTESITEAKYLAEQLSLVTDIKVDGSTAYISGKVDNIFRIDAEVSLITALYDSKGSLIDITNEKKQIDADTQNINSRIDIGTKDVHRIKAYVWQNLDTIIPLCTASEYRADEIFADGGFEDEDGFYKNWATSKQISGAVRTSAEAFSGKYSAYFSNTSVSDGTVLDKGASLQTKNILPLIRKNGVGKYELSVTVKTGSDAAKFRTVLQTRRADGVYEYKTLTEKSGINYIDVFPDKWTKYTAETDISDIDGISSMVLMFESPGKYGDVSYPAQKIYLDAVSMYAVSTEKYTPSKRTNIYLVGDSICTNYLQNGKNQQGWGYYFDDLFNSDDTLVFNCAKGGWTTDSFILGQAINSGVPHLTECELWSGISDAVKEGDYVIISLGHNDSSKSNFRATSEERYKENLTKMVNEVKNKNATPVLIASIPIVWDEYWKDKTDEKSQMVPLKEQPVSIYGGYMKEVAENTGAVFLDVNSHMAEEYNSLGMALTRSTYYIDDNVHLNDYGAQYVCKVIADMISDNPALEDLKNKIKQ